MLLGDDVSEEQLQVAKLNAGVATEETTLAITNSEENKQDSN